MISQLSVHRHSDTSDTCLKLLGNQSPRQSPRKPGNRLQAAQEHPEGVQRECLPVRKNHARDLPQNPLHFRAFETAQK